MQKWEIVVIGSAPTEGFFSIVPGGLIDFEWAKTELEARWVHEKDGSETVERIPKEKRFEAERTFFKHISDDGWEPVNMYEGRILFKRPIED